MKVLKYLPLLLLLLSCKQSVGQTQAMNIERNVLDSLDEDYGYYLAITPKSKDIKGTMVLMPGFGQKAENVFIDTDLHKFAFENGLMTISISTGMRMSADEMMQTKISALLRHAISKYDLKKENFVFGGFSAGGRICLRYVELCKQYPANFPVDPSAVFMADAPVDVFHSWEMMQSLKEAANSEMAVQEANWVEKMYREQYGTTPGEKPEIFKPFNPFSLNEKIEGNERFLKNVAVRAYHDVDIPWRLINRNQSVQHSNFLVSSELINRLLLLGNTKAEFVQTYQTGFRANGKRHPHSWSIIDSRTCIEWILKNLDGTSSVTPQKTKEEAIVPILINKETLSGLNLSRGKNPEQPDRKLFFQNIFRGETLSVQVISSGNASASPEDLGIDEFLFLVNGGARLSPKGAAEKTFIAGDFFMVPRGFNGDWETIGSPSFHHEISVTTVERNEAALDSKKTMPVLMDKQKIAGLGITKTSQGKYYDLLYEGHELTITLEGELPQVKKIESPLQEQIIYIAEGTLSLWDSSGKEYNFTTGDFVVVPQGFTGTWQSRGHELFRFLKMRKSEWK